jgi:hypothetical protein
VRRLGFADVVIGQRLRCLGRHNFSAFRGRFGDRGVGGRGVGGLPCLMCCLPCLGRSLVRFAAHVIRLSSPVLVSVGL